MSACPTIRALRARLPGGKGATRKAVSAHCLASSPRRVQAPIQLDQVVDKVSARVGNDDPKGQCFDVLVHTDYKFYQEIDPDQITEQFLWDSLLPSLRYLGADDQCSVQNALTVAYSAHEGQYRKSGEPFITHPLEVCRILAELGAEPVMLIAGLLHDTVEDTDRVCLETIREKFGPDCAQIVEGETKFSKLGQIHADMTKEELQAMDLQQLFLAMTEDFRIIVVKLADRLHNMRTMASMPPVKQRKIALETIRVFAPLAGLLGLWRIKVELEDLSIMYYRPAVYKVLEAHRRRQVATQASSIEEAQRTTAEVISEKMGPDGITVNVHSKVRTIFSMYKAVQSQISSKLAGKPMEDVPDEEILRLIKSHRVLDTVSDVVKLNVVVGGSSTDGTPDDAQLCYRVLGVLHTLWAPVPGAVKDFIATPKRNGYTGLHTVLLTRGCQTTRPVEVVIHTHAMHMLAEFGIAADAWVREEEDSWRAQTGRLPRMEGDGAGPGEANGAANGHSMPRSDGVNGAAVLNIADAESMQAVNGSAANGSAANGAAPNGASANGANGSSITNKLPTIGIFVKNGVSLGALWEAASPLLASFTEPFNSADGQQARGQAAECEERDAAAVLANKLGTSAIARRVNWLQSIRTWQEEFLCTVSATEFVNVIQQDLLSQTVFCFTPAGDIRRLPLGATVVDFAYHIHSEVGNCMVSARVNNRVVSVDHELRNADVVEIVQYAPAKLREYNIRRHREWLPLARTQAARHKLIKFLKSCDGHHGLSIDSVGAEPECKTAWITLECRDRSGILGDVATTIARHGGNIDEHSGGNGTVSSRLGYMAFKVTASSEAFTEICEELQGVPAVDNLYFGQPTGSPR